MAEPNDSEESRDGALGRFTGLHFDNLFDQSDDESGERWNLATGPPRPHGRILVAGRDTRDGADNGGYGHVNDEEVLCLRGLSKLS